MVWWTIVTLLVVAYLFMSHPCSFNLKPGIHRSKYILKFHTCMTHHSMQHMIGLIMLTFRKLNGKVLALYDIKNIPQKQPNKSGKPGNYTLNLYRWQMPVLFQLSYVGMIFYDYHCGLIICVKESVFSLDWFPNTMN